MSSEIMYKNQGGAVIAPGDDRNYIYEDVVFGAPQVDWKKGFDIRNILRGDIQTKDQGPSLSCVGQAWSYQVWIYQVLEAMKETGMNLTELREERPDLVQEVSAKAIYSQIHLLGGAAYIYAGAKLATKWGALYESQVPSKDQDGNIGETFMQDKQWKTEAMDNLAKTLQGKDYRVIRSKDNMEMFALAVMVNFGVVGGVTGQNGRGWKSERPQPPKDHIGLWGHCIDYLAFGEDEYGRFIATPNSWGDFFAKDKWEPGAPPGHGWQKLYQDYFTSKWQFDPWTYTDKPNVIANDMLKLIKGDKSERIYVVGVDGKLAHVHSMPTLDRGAEMGMWERFDIAKHTVPQEQVDAMPKGNPIAFIL